jgi:RNA polymerase sigma-70 factor (ECF subfamily)
MIESLDATANRAIAVLRDQGGAALADLFVEHRDRLRRMVEVRLDRRAAGRIDPSDVLQETFIEASCRLRDYLDDPPMSPFLWLRFLTSQRLMAVHRKHLGVQKRAAEREISLHQPFAAPTDSLTLSRQLVDCLTSPSLVAVRNEMYVYLQEVIDGMEPLDREILSLRHYEELTNREAAGELGITQAAASKRYVRALERLRSALMTLPGFQDAE